MSKTRIILSDSSLNSYGYRVLTEGIDLEAFKKNPIMMYMHYRDEGSRDWGYMAIGHWEDFEVDGDKLSAVPIFDKVDDTSKTVAAKFEAGTFRAASIGIRIIETSEDNELLVSGQTRATVTKCRLIEVSIVDIPSNPNAVRLYDRSDLDFLAAGPTTNCSVPKLKKEVQMNLKASWKSVLAFLKVGEDKAEATQLSSEQMESLNAEMDRLQQENAQLKADKQDAASKLAAANGEVTTLKNGTSTKDTEISNLKSSIQSKDVEINQLKEQVTNLKKQPAGDDKNLNPGKEPVGEGNKEDLADFCKNADNKDYAGLSARLKEEGLL